MFLIKNLPINRVLLIVQPHKDKANLIRKSEKLLMVYFAFQLTLPLQKKYKLLLKKKPKIWEVQPQGTCSGVITEGKTGIKLNSLSLGVLCPHLGFGLAHNGPNLCVFKQSSFS